MELFKQENARFITLRSVELDDAWSGSAASAHERADEKERQALVTQGSGCAFLVRQTSEELAKSGECSPSYLRSSVFIPAISVLVDFRRLNLVWRAMPNFATSSSV